MKIKLAKIIIDNEGNNIIDYVKYVGDNNIIIDDDSKAKEFPTEEEAKEIAIKLSTDNDMFYSLYQ